VNALLVPDLSENRYVGMIAVEVEPRSRTFIYANAGHPSGYLLDGAGRIKMELASTGIVLGLFGDAEFPSVRGPGLDCGDLLVLFTDGVTEAFGAGDALYSEPRLQARLQTLNEAPVPDLVTGVIDDVRAFSAGVSQSDDITVLAVRRPGPSGEAGR
jgi:sigma-B regulation protein RsbU (phosphoserine phosphatase)